MTLLDMQPLGWVEWKEQLVSEFSTRAAMTIDEARKMVDGAGDDCWHEFWADAYTPSETASEEMSCWDDDGDADEESSAAD